MLKKPNQALLANIQHTPVYYEPNDLLWKIRSVVEYRCTTVYEHEWEARQAQEYTRQVHNLEITSELLQFDGAKWDSILQRLRAIPVGTIRELEMLSIIKDLEDLREGYCAISS